MKDKGSAALQRAVRMGEVSVSDAAKCCEHTHAQQDKALERFRLGERSTVAKALPPKKKPPKPRTKLTDKLGAELPGSCRDAFADKSFPDFVSTMEQVSGTIKPEAWVKKVGDLAPHYPFILLKQFDEHIHDAARSLQLALESVTAGVPHAVCPRCKGEPKPGKTCAGCRGASCVPEHRYAELKEQTS